MTKESRQIEEDRPRPFKHVTGGGVEVIIDPTKPLTEQKDVLALLERQGNAEVEVLEHRCKSLVDSIHGPHFRALSKDQAEAVYRDLATLLHTHFPGADWLPPLEP